MQVLSFAQYNHTQLYANGNIVEQGQYNADPGITSTDSKETIAKKWLSSTKLEHGNTSMKTDL